MPGRFGLKYVGGMAGSMARDAHRRSWAPGAFYRDLHRAHGGDFPFWLSPVQVVILPIAGLARPSGPRTQGRLASRGCVRKSTIGARPGSGSERVKPEDSTLVGDEEVERGTVPRDCVNRSRQRRDVGGGCRGARPGEHRASQARWPEEEFHSARSRFRSFNPSEIRPGEREIRVREVRVIGADGEQLGVMPPKPPSTSPERTVSIWWRSP